MATQNYWDTYRALVKRLLPPLKAGDGFTEAEIANAERKLGLKTPALLREFYLLTGRREDINGVHDRLMTPPERSDTMLVFYEENQGVCSWALALSDLDQHDPKVFRAPDNGPWEEDFPRLSEFLTAMLLFQCVSGGMRHSGVGAASTAKIQNLATGWETLEIGGEWNNHVYLRDGQAVFIMGRDPEPEVYAGAKTKLKFLDIGRQFGVRWGYCTLDDE